MKRVVSLFIAVMLVMLTVPYSYAQSLTEGIYTYTVNDGCAIITAVDKKADGEIIVPATLGDCPVTVIGEKAFYQCDKIDSIIIPYGVIALGRNAFESCGADYIQIPDSVTEIDGPFADRHYASDFYIECYIDSQIWHYAYTCRINTRSITFEELPDNDGVLRYKYNHSGAVVCGRYDNTAEHIVIPDYIGGMPVVSIVRGAFYDGVTKSITFPSTLKYIRDDVSLSGGESGEIVLPDGLEYIGNMAFSGLGVKKVHIPSSVTFIGEYAFDQCINAVIFGEEGSLAEEYAKQHGIPFNEEEPEPSYLVYEINDGEATLTGCTLQFGTIDIPETLGGCPVTKIADGVFRNFDQLGGVILPDTVKEIGDEAFAGCFNLLDFVIPDSVVSIGDRAFEGDFQFSLITIGKNVTHIGENAFSGCEALKIYGEGGSYTETYAGENGLAFKVYDEEEGYLSYEIIDGKAVVTGSDQVRGDVVIPETLGGCPVTKIGEGAFYYKYQFTSVTLPETVEYIEDYAFGHCGNLTEFTVPDSVKTIGEYAFMECTGLEKITFGRGITQIGNNAFDGCTVVFYIPDTLSAAYEYAAVNGISYEILPPAEPAVGDVTCDGKVTLADVSLILKHIAKWNVTVDADYADVTGDGSINLSDVTLLLKYIAGWNVTLG